MYPKHLVTEYWEEVRELLQNKHNLSDRQAREGIAGYRALMDTHEAGEVIYNQHPYQVAEVIAGLVGQDYFHKPEFFESVPVESPPLKKAAESVTRRRKQA